MPCMVRIVGSSGSGKTTFVEGVLPALRKRGLRVGTVKHASHGFSADRPGSDSDRHRVAGASPVLLTGPSGHVLFDLEPPTERPSLGDLVDRYFGNRDLVLVEGHTLDAGAYVMVTRRGAERRNDIPTCGALFVVCDESAGHPVEIAPGDSEAAADLLVAHLREAAAPAVSPTVRRDSPLESSERSRAGMSPTTRQSPTGLGAEANLGRSRWD